MPVPVFGIGWIGSEGGVRIGGVGRARAGSLRASAARTRGLVVKLSLWAGLRMVPRTAGLSRNLPLST